MSIEPGAPFRLDAAWTSQALLLSAEAGWNQTAADWDVFLRHGTVFGLAVAGRLVATAAALPYGPSLGWVSLVLVTAAWRRRGLAGRLVARCTALLQVAGRVPFLDATEAGAAVYARLGFQPMGTVLRVSGQGGGLPASREADGRKAALALDRAAFGADRGFLLHDVMDRPGTRSFSCPGGLALLRRGAQASQLGPVIAGPAEAPGLLAAALDTAAGPVIVDLTDAGAVMLPALAARGFQVRRRFTRMALGRTALPGLPGRVLAAAGPEFG